MLENNSWPHSAHTYIPEGSKNQSHSLLWNQDLYTSRLFHDTHLAGSDSYNILHQKRGNKTFPPCQIQAKKFDNYE